MFKLSNIYLSAKCVLKKLRISVVGLVKSEKTCDKHYFLIIEDETNILGGTMNVFQVENMHESIEEFAQEPTRNNKMSLLSKGNFIANLACVKV